MEKYSPDSEDGIEISRDEAAMVEMGYKQDLAREYSMLEIFGLSFSVMSLAPSIASVLTDAVAAGGVGFSWSWVLPAAFFCCVAASSSELASSMPTAGGWYYWTFKLAPPKYKKVLSFFVGYGELCGLIAGGASTLLGFTNQLLAAVEMNRNFTATNGETYGVQAAALLLTVILGYMPSRIMSKIQFLSIFLNIVAVGLLIVGLPVGLKRKGIHLNSASYVFGNTDNYTNWPYGMSFLMSTMGCVWTTCCLAAAPHLAEEAKDARKAVPFSMMLSSTLMLFVGWVVMCILAAVVDNTPEGVSGLQNAILPIANVISRCLGQRWSTALVSFFCAIQYIMGCSSTLSTSRLAYALARDNALPFSRFWKMVTKSGIPYLGLVFVCVMAALISLLILAGATAANALFSMVATSLYFVWSVPILLRVIYGDEKTGFNPGPFYMGRWGSRICGTLAATYLIFYVFTISIFPADIPVTSPAAMNWSSVVTFGVWILAGIYYYLYARKIYRGPVSTLGEDEYVEVMEAVSVRHNDKQTTKARQD